jgi:hypothetical protein
VRFFLLAVPDKFYLWKEIGLSTEEIEPDYEINPEPFLKPYHRKAYEPDDDISNPASGAAGELSTIIGIV